MACTSASWSMPPDEPLALAAAGHIGGVAHRAVIRQDDDVGLFHKWSNRVGKHLAARRFVFRDRHVAEEHLDLRQNALRDRLTGDRKRTRMRRMAVNDALHIGALT